ncbi:MAG: tetratricopeptide repeat protein [Planctomycetes bacterium]|nr:tetratricopeptide repeat protein [Planctomycetota bacterium]
MRTFVAAALAGALLVGAGANPRPARADDKKDKAVEGIEAAAKARDYKKVIELASAAIKDDPKNPGFHFALGTAHLELHHNDEALKALTKVIELEPTFAPAYDRRGDANLKLGNFEAAVKDFDTYLAKVNEKKRDEAKKHHWRRGIALYYAGEYQKGADQFKLHHEVNKNDVENSVWRYLCVIQAEKQKKSDKPKETAREALFKADEDTRVPMKEVLEMFNGKKKPEDVLKAADVGNSKLMGEALKEAQFYANLYVALYFESEGNEAKCKEHLKTAVETYKIGHYMWDVAAAHLKKLEKKP